MIGFLVKGNQPIVTKFCENALRKFGSFFFPQSKNPTKPGLFHIFNRIFNNTYFGEGFTVRKAKNCQG